MTSSKERNIGGFFLKSNIYFIWILFEILFELEKYAFLGQKNVHFDLNILSRRRKLVLVFLEFFLSENISYQKYIRGDNMTSSK